MKDKEQIEEMPICVNCAHAYVCEEYNLNRDMLRKRCAYYNDHFLDIEQYKKQTSKETVDKILKMFEAWEDKPYVSKEDFKQSIADLFGVEIERRDMEDKEKKLTEVIEKVLRDTINCGMSIETLTDYLVDRIKDKFHAQDSVMLSMGDYEHLKAKSTRIPIDKDGNFIEYAVYDTDRVLSKSEYRDYIYNKASKETAEKILNKGKQLVEKWLSRDDEKVGFRFDFEEFIKEQFCIDIKGAVMKDKENQICKHFDEEVCSRLDCKKDCKYYGKANCKTCIHEDICQLRTFSYCKEEVKEYLKNRANEK